MILGIKRKDADVKIVYGSNFLEGIRSQEKDFLESLKADDIGCKSCELIEVPEEIRIFRPGLKETRNEFTIQIESNLRLINLLRNACLDSCYRGLSGYIDIVKFNLDDSYRESVSRQRYHYACKLGFFYQKLIEDKQIDLLVLSHASYDYYCAPLAAAINKKKRILVVNGGQDKSYEYLYQKGLSDPSLAGSLCNLFMEASINSERTKKIIGHIDLNLNHSFAGTKSNSNLFGQDQNKHKDNALFMALPTFLEVQLHSYEDQGYFQSKSQWLQTILEQAKKENIKVFAMMHPESSKHGQTQNDKLIISSLLSRNEFGAVTVLEATSNASELLKDYNLTPITMNGNIATEIALNGKKCIISNTCPVMSFPGLYTAYNPQIHKLTDLIDSYQKGSVGKSLDTEKMLAKYIMQFYLSLGKKDAYDLKYRKAYDKVFFFGKKSISASNLQTIIELHDMETSYSTFEIGCFKYLKSISSCML